MKRTTHKPILCPRCGLVSRSSTDVTQDPELGDTDSPAPGNYAVCFRCLEVNVYTAALTLRVPTAAEQADIDTPESQETVRVIREKIRAAKDAGRGNL